MVEIVIVTSKSVQDVSINEYANRLFNKWEIGKKSNYHGLLILVVTSDEVYYQYYLIWNKNIFTDEQISKIGSDIFIPHFNNGEWGEGLYEAVQEITNIVEENPHVFSIPDGEIFEYKITVRMQRI